ncbi:hypothetical protein Ancab_032381 [Ancistrocladus abbreviatus]
MAKVADMAAPGSLPSDSIHFCGGAAKAGLLSKRKTPSELREEQLKRRKFINHVDDSPAFLQDLNMVDLALNKPDPPKSTRYIEMRLDEVYPVKKPSSRLRLLSGKGTAKESKLFDESARLKSSLPSNLAPKCHLEFNCFDNSATTAPNANGNADQQCQTTEKSDEIQLRSVAELSLGSDLFTNTATVDMDKALKGLAIREPYNSVLSAVSLEKCGDLKSSFTGTVCREFHVPGIKVPLDFTLKTTMRILSSSPINWFHRLLMSGTYNGMLLPSQFSCSENKNFSRVSKSPFTAETYYANSSQSWMYPQSSLPLAVISALSSATGAVELDFLKKRQLAWEDSFRNLYYLIRKNACNIFYVCTSLFVVMFTAVGKTKRKCNAYVSQSTRGLRSVLREHDVCFSMPLCSSEVEQISREDIELSEIEKHNLGQTKRLSTMSEVDNTPQSLLAFNGNKSVHGLYDFLLNYKSFLTSLTGVDVPVLCSPAPFRNAAPSAPEVKCREIKTADHLASESRGSAMKDGESNVGSSGAIFYSIEIKDVFLTPWTVSSVLESMASEGKSFEASFTTDPISMGLNVALDEFHRKSDPQGSVDEKSQPNINPLGIEAVVSSDLHRALVKVLKYCNGSYTATILPA